MSRERTQQDEVDKLLRSYIDAGKSGGSSFVRDVVEFTHSWLAKSQGLPRGIEARAFAQLLSDYNAKERGFCREAFLEYVARILPALMVGSKRAFESAISDDEWTWVFLRSLCSEHCDAVLEAADENNTATRFKAIWPAAALVMQIRGSMSLKKADLRSRIGAEAIAAACHSVKQWVRKTMPLISLPHLLELCRGDTESLVSELADVLDCDELSALQRKALRATLSEWLETLEDDKHRVTPAGLVMSIKMIVDEPLALRVSRDQGPSWWAKLSRIDSDLCQTIAQQAPDHFAASLRQIWEHSADWTPLMKKFPFPMAQWPLKTINQLSSEFGFEAGLYAFGKDLAHDDSEAFAKFLQEHGCFWGAKVVGSVHTHTQLWLVVRRYSDFHANSWKRDTEKRGMDHALQGTVDMHPAEWASALPMLIQRSHLLGNLVESVSVLLARKRQDVRVAIDSCARSHIPVLRDRARGIQAILKGIDPLDDGLANDLLSFAARLLDGVPAFPHPLSVKSSTWLGSLTVEELVREGVQRAEKEFSDYFADTGRIEEEANVARLLVSLEYAFRNIPIRAAAFGDAAKICGNISLSHKQVPKSEEADFGCDIAIRVLGDIDRCLQTESAELIQVKKPVASPHLSDEAAQFRDTWRIDAAQLDSILSFTQTAAYWLIDKDGTVFCLPARLLQAIQIGSERQSQGSFTVPYTAVRSMGIPLHQHLVQLILGIWVGSSTDEVLSFAKGENTKTKPRHIVEIEVHHSIDANS